MIEKKKKREIAADPLYDSVLVSKFINHVMTKGKKSVARKIVYESFEIMKEKEKNDPLKIFEMAIENVSPIMEVRSKRVGGATYQVPVTVDRGRRVSLAMRWIINASRAKKGRSMKERLSEELLNASKNTGTAVKKREDIHKVAEANKAFAHFA